MDVAFLDTNIILRYITRDNPNQAEQARHLLRQVETGEVRLTTCEGVIVEVVQVLSSKALYNLARPAIRTHLGAILGLKGLKLSHKRAYLRALELYTAYPFLDFVDALNVAYMERAKIAAIFSFDRDYDRVAGITRQEPGLATGQQ